MFSSFQSVLPSAIKNLKLKREIEAALICEKYRKLAPRHVHVNALQHTFPKYFKAQTLTVGVENAAWAAQIKSREAELRKALNDALGREAVQRIRTLVSPEMKKEN